MLEIWQEVVAMRQINTIRRASRIFFICLAIFALVSQRTTVTLASPKSTLTPTPLRPPPRELLMPLPFRSFVGQTPVMSVAFAPNSQELLTSTMEGTVILWNILSGNEIRRFVGHTGDVHRAVFSNDSKYVVTASVWFDGPPDTTIRLWDAQTGHELTQIGNNTNVLNTHLIWPNTVALSNDGAYILTGGYYGRDYTSSGGPEAQLWDIHRPKLVGVFQNHSQMIWSVDLSADGNYALTAGSEYINPDSEIDTTARLWDVQTGAEIRQFIGHSKLIRSAQFSPDGRYVLTGSDDKSIRLWDASTGEQIRLYAGHTDVVSSVAFSPNGRCIVSGSWDQTVRIWDTQTGKQLRKFRPGFIQSVAFSPDGRYIAAGGVGDGSNAYIWGTDMPCNAQNGN